MACEQVELEKVEEALEALAQLPDGQPQPALLQRLQPHLQRPRRGEVHLVLAAIGGLRLFRKQSSERARVVSVLGQRSAKMQGGDGDVWGSTPCAGCRRRPAVVGAW